MVSAVMAVVSLLRQAVISFSDYRGNWDVPTPPELIAVVEGQSAPVLPSPASPDRSIWSSTTAATTTLSEQGKIDYVREVANIMPLRRAACGKLPS